MAIRNVVLAGGVSGNLGPAILKAVSSSTLFDVTVFTRPGSSPSLPAGVKSVAVDYDSVDDLTAKLQGQDAVVSTLAPTATEQQKNLITAAVAARVSRFLPSEFGSDLDNPVNRGAPVYAGKVRIQELLKSLAQEGKITYTVVYNGAFLDWGLRLGFVQDPKNKRAVLHDGGERPFTATTLPTVGKAVVGVLTHPDETRNRTVRVGEAVTTLKEILALSQEIVGSEGWTVIENDTEKGAARALEKVRQGIFTRESMLPFIQKAIWGANTGGYFREDGQ